MSTYYKFVCKECNKSGGFLSQQAWGIGNFDIIESFKFLGLHMGHKPYMYSEHDDTQYDTPEHDKSEFIEESKGIMPSSNDWDKVSKNEWKDVEKIWEREFLGE